MRRPLRALLDTDGFVARHIGPDDADVDVMLRTLGVPSLDELLDRTVPASIRQVDPIPLPGPRTEADVLAELRGIAAENRVMTNLIGQGYYGTITPPVVLRNVLENPAWYTAYTPYQPEISQGRLEALLNFQTMVADLTGLDLANASMLDEGTAAAEAMAMAHRVTTNAGVAFFVDADTHPQTIAVIETRAVPLGIEVIVGDPADLPADRCFGALFSWPGSSGRLRDPGADIERLHAAGGIAVVATDLLASVVLSSAGALGADIAIGSAQRFGVPMGFGGPHAGFLATRDAHARSLPGRLVGVSTDSAGRPAMRLALQTREQHIRRDRATSNICTAQVLLANIAGLYAAYHGPEGLRTIAERVHRLTSILVAGVREAGLELGAGSWFDTVTIATPGRADAVLAAAVELGINLRRTGSDSVGLSLDETSMPATVVGVWRALGARLDLDDVERLDASAADGIPDEWRRVGEFLTHAVFNRYQTEHEMLRYLRRLADRDLALDRTMIPLGSCTMKLNATTEMIPITWPEFADIHPFVPAEQAAGYHRLVRSLEQMLVAITGYDAVSLQPNAGSQGELAGLLAIRAFHASHGEHERTICLIPASAHGTNAASAVMAGMKVQVVACDADGNVDLLDLEAKVTAAGSSLAALMITYPSTHGVFEEEIGRICAIVHDHGGQVYVDGANLNALVGLARPGRFGADVSHLNLHKTFCIPHGGGGPGVGPVAVRAHLAPFLPGDPLAPAGSQPVGPVSAAPYGSASILPISWVYIALMGASGLRRASEIAILSANYVARRLSGAYPVLYTGRNGFVAHECILDLRPITKQTGVTVDDVAKRLMDFGFHAPTISFPVAGTLMVEPTESESRRELDRFVDAMLEIHAEIEQIANGSIAVADSPLRHAPHTAEDLLGPWDRSYPAHVGAFPGATSPASKYFPPVSRIDAAYGDRHLVCSCPPIETFANG